jgi:glucosamine-6-phosphate deaminase
MKLIIKEDYEGMTDAALEVFLEYFPESTVLGFATGNTPVLLYERLSALCRAGKISFRDKISFNLDEYCGLGPKDRHSYRYYMDSRLFGSIDIQAKNIHFPDGTLPEKDSVAMYSRELGLLGPIDLQILGIGKNGHIAFNEPGSGIDSVTRVTELQSETVERNKAPVQRAITMGMKEILSARTILLMASGKDKSEALLRTVRGTPSPSTPASFLQSHKNTYIFADKDAARNLQDT